MENLNHIATIICWCIVGALIIGVLAIVFAFWFLSIIERRCDEQINDDRIFYHEK